jgi:hypothetical protein
MFISRSSCVALWCVDNCMSLTVCLFSLRTHTVVMIPKYLSSKNSCIPSRWQVTTHLSTTSLRQTVLFYSFYDETEIWRNCELFIAVVMVREVMVKTIWCGSLWIKDTGTYILPDTQCSRSRVVCLPRWESRGSASWGFHSFRHSFSRCLAGVCYRPESVQVAENMCPKNVYPRGAYPRVTCCISIWRFHNNIGWQKQQNWFSHSSRGWTCAPHHRYGFTW